MEEADFNNISVEEFLANAQYMILSNEGATGVELIDSEGRVWFLELLSDNTSKIN